MHGVVVSGGRRAPKGGWGGAGHLGYRICETTLGNTPQRCLCPTLTLLLTHVQDYTGLAWLFLGVANSDALLYDDEWQPIVKNFPNNFKLDYALSREQKNKAGGKMYIQDKVGEYADEVFTRMDNGGHMYFCGLKVLDPPAPIPSPCPSPSPSLARTHPRPLPPSPSPSRTLPLTLTLSPTLSLTSLTSLTHPPPHPRRA